MQTLRGRYVCSTLSPGLGQHLLQMIFKKWWANELVWYIMVHKVLGKVLSCVVMLYLMKIVLTVLGSSSGHSFMGHQTQRYSLFLGEMESLRFLWQKSPFTEVNLHWKYKNTVLCAHKNYIHFSKFPLYIFHLLTCGSENTKSSMLANPVRNTTFCVFSAPLRGAHMIWLLVGEYGLYI